MTTVESATLFVDLGDRRAVGAVLEGVYGLGVTEVAVSDGLQLSKLQLHAADGFASVVAAVVAPTGIDAPTAGPVERLTQAEQLDILLAHLRTTPPPGHTGSWAPVVERDHDVTAHGTNPHVKIADEVPPEEFAPVTPSDRIPAGSANGPRIGIADAVLYAHPDLAGRFVGESLATHQEFGAPGPGHASVVAGTVLRHCPDALLDAHAVLRPEEANGSWEVGERLLSFLHDGVDLLNMSFGCISDGRPSLPLQRAVDRLSQQIVLVAALGNYDADDDPTLEHYPAAFDSVLAVGAADAGGQPSTITPAVPWLDALAPEHVVGPFLIGDVTFRRRGVRRYESGYVSWSGSSFSAAAVTGAVAQLMVERGIDAREARDAVLAGGSQNAGIFAATPGGPA